MRSLCGSWVKGVLVLLLLSLLTLFGCGPGSIRTDFTDRELTAFYDQHRAACVASYANILQHHDVRGLQDALHENLTKPITGTVLGKRIIWPDSREKGEKVAWYVGGDDGCLYYCDREFGEIIQDKS